MTARILTTVAIIASESSWSRLGGYFGVALLLVLPYGIRTMRRIAARRRAQRAAQAASEATQRPISEVAVLVETIHAELDQLDPGEPFTVWIPPGLTIRGQPLPDALARSVVIDDLARSGLHVEPLADGTLACSRPSR